jgi:integrase
VPNVTRVDLPYLWLPLKRGKLAAYYRRGGLARRICGPDGKPLVPGDAGFLDAYQAMHREASRSVELATPAPRSLSALIIAYRASEEWQELAELTRQDYGRVLKALDAAFGSKSVPDMPRAAVFTVRDKFSRDVQGKPTPRRANKAVAVLRLLLSWAVDRGWRKDNPALRPGQLRTGPGYATWTADQVALFLACDSISEPLKRAAVLGFYTGMRVSDCLTLPKTARRDGMVEVVPAKTQRTTRARALIPEHPELTRWLNAAPASDAVTLLTRQDGLPWKVDHFKHAFVAAARSAGLPAGHSFHGLRKGLSAALAEAGASDAEIEAVIPHADPRMTRHYRAQAEQQKLATAAIARLPGANAGTQSDPRARKK